MRFRRKGNVALAAFDWNKMENGEVKGFRLCVATVAVADPISPIKSKYGTTS